MVNSASPLPYEYLRCDGAMGKMTEIQVQTPSNAGSAVRLSIGEVLGLSSNRTGRVAFVAPPEAGWQSFYSIIRKIEARANDETGLHLGHA